MDKHYIIDYTDGTTYEVETRDQLLSVTAFLESVGTKYCISNDVDEAFSDGAVPFSMFLVELKANEIA